MREELKNKISSCTDIRDKDGKILSAVCVATGKDFSKKDIIFMDKERDTISVRSTTELMNKLAKMSVPFEERKKVMDFTAERLRALELEESKRTKAEKKVI